MHILAGSLLFLVGLGILVAGRNEFKLRQRIQNTPTSTPSSVALGLVEITGTAREASETLRAPLHDRPALLYHYALFEYERQEDEENSERIGSRYEWEGLESGTHGVPFFLGDDGGRVLVDPADADARIPSSLAELRSGEPPSSSVTWTPEDGPPEKVRAFLNRCSDLADYRIEPGHRFTPTDQEPLQMLGSHLARKYALAIERVEPGDTLYLLGQAQRPNEQNIPDNVENVPDDVPAIFRSSTSEDPSLLDRIMPASTRGDYSSVFVLSTQSEEGVIDDTKSRERKLLSLGLVFALTGLVWLAVPYL